jgi:hypothetical protein
MNHSKLTARFARIVDRHGAVSAERIAHLTRVPVATVLTIMFNEMPKFYLTHAELWVRR